MVSQGGVVPGGASYGCVWRGLLRLGKVRYGIIAGRAFLLGKEDEKNKMQSPRRRSVYFYTPNALELEQRIRKFSVETGFSFSKAVIKLAEIGLDFYEETETFNVKKILNKQIKNNEAI